MKYYQGYKSLNTVKDFTDWGVVIEQGHPGMPLAPFYFLLASVVLLITVLLFV